MPWSVPHHRSCGTSAHRLIRPEYGSDNPVRCASSRSGNPWIAEQHLTSEHLQASPPRVGRVPLVRLTLALWLLLPLADSLLDLRVERLNALSSQ